MTKSLDKTQQADLIQTLKERFQKNSSRHAGINWSQVESKLLQNPDKLWSLQEMEDSGGEPDLVEVDNKTGQYLFFDCSPETPAGRRNLCYDREALDARKAAKPANSAADMASGMGIEILTEEQYQLLQKFGEFDTKTSSWLATPEKIRDLGGALFGDRRYNHVFIYHNGASSYYSSRGFRGALRV